MSSPEYYPAEIDPQHLELVGMMHQYAIEHGVAYNRGMPGPCTIETATGIAFTAWRELEKLPAPHFFGRTIGGQYLLEQQQAHMMAYADLPEGVQDYVVKIEDDKDDECIIIPQTGVLLRLVQEYRISTYEPIEEEHRVLIKINDENLCIPDDVMFAPADRKLRASELKVDDFLGNFSNKNRKSLMKLMERSKQIVVQQYTDYEEEHIAPIRAIRRQLQQISMASKSDFMEDAQGIMAKLYNDSL